MPNPIQLSWLGTTLDIAQLDIWRTPKSGLTPVEAVIAANFYTVMLSVVNERRKQLDDIPTL